MTTLVQLLLNYTLKLKKRVVMVIVNVKFIKHIL